MDEDVNIHLHFSFRVVFTFYNEEETTTKGAIMLFIGGVVAVTFVGYKLVNALDNMYDHHEFRAF